MKKSRTSLFKILFGLAISALCLALAIRGINFEALLGIFKTVRIPFVILLMLGICATIVLRALIYLRFLSRLNKVRLFPIIEGLLIGYLISSIFPLRAGDIIKSYVIGKLNRVSKTYTFTLALIERFFDMLTLFMSFLLLLCIAEVQKHYRIAAAVMASGLAILIVIIIVILRSEDLLPKVVDRAGFFLPLSMRTKIKDRVSIMRDALKILCNWRDVLFLQGIFLAIYSGYIGISYMTGLAIGLKLSLSLILMMLVTYAIGASIAASPGGLGVHQYAAVLVFSYFHLSRESALSFSLIQNTLTVALTILLGWIFLLHTNLTIAGAMSSGNDNEQKGLDSQSC